MSNIGIDWVRIRRERARLIILKALAEQENGSLDSSMIEEILPLFAIRETRLFVHEQMEFLAERDAVTLAKAGSVMIATLNKRGRRHLQRDTTIEGVSRPSEPGE